MTNQEIRHTMPYIDPNIPNRKKCAGRDTIAYYTFDETKDESGLNVGSRDFSGNEYDVTSAAITLQSASKYGAWCHQFTAASSEHITFSGTISGTTYPITLDAWVWLSAQPASDQTFMWMGDKDADDAFISLGITSGGVAFMETSETGDVLKISGGDDLSDSTWYRITGVWKNSVQRELYVDGVSKSTAGSTKIGEPAFDRISFGRHGGATPAEYFDGRIDNPSIFNIDTGGAERGINICNPGLKYLAGVTTKTDDENFKCSSLTKYPNDWCNGATIEIIGGVLDRTKATIKDFVASTGQIILGPDAGTLVAKYIFDEGADPTVGDSAGSFDLTTANTPTWTATGGWDNLEYISFASATSEYAEGAVTPVLSYPIIMSCWIRRNGQPGATEIVMWYGDKDVDNAYLSLGLDSSGRAFSELSKAGSILRQTASSDITDNEWHQVIAVYRTATSRELYVDDVSEETAGSNDIAAPSFDRLTIGRFAGATPAKYFDGDMDDVEIYSGDYGWGSSGTVAVDDIIGIHCNGNQSGEVGEPWCGDGTTGTYADSTLYASALAQLSQARFGLIQEEPIKDIELNDVTEIVQLGQSTLINKSGNDGTNYTGWETFELLLNKTPANYVVGEWVNVIDKLTSLNITRRIKEIRWEYRGGTLVTRLFLTNPKILF